MLLILVNDVIYGKGKKIDLCVLVEDLCKNNYQVVYFIF